MTHTKTIRRQPPVKGGRDPLPACVLGEIRARIDSKARQFGVSRSWVVATILADYLGVDEQVDFKTGRRKGERR